MNLWTSRATVFFFRAGRATSSLHSIRLGPGDERRRREHIRRVRFAPRAPAFSLFYTSHARGCSRQNGWRDWEGRKERPSVWSLVKIYYLADDDRQLVARHFGLLTQLSPPAEIPNPYELTPGCPGTLAGKKQSKAAAAQAKFLAGGAL